MAIEHTGDNQHIGYYRLEVLPEYRCQGLGRRMLSMVLAFAREHHRSLLMTWASDRIPAAEILMEHIGARKGQESHTNQLMVAALDQSLMDRWLKKGEHLESEFEVGLWVGAIPEEHIVEMAALMQELANDQPRDNLEMEDMKFTPEMMREVENYF